MRKKIHLSCLVLLGVSLLTGCSHQPYAKVPATSPTATSTQTAELDTVYTNNDLGIQFTIDAPYEKEHIRVANNQIGYAFDADTVVPHISVFSKTPTQTITEAMQALISEQGNDPDNCAIIDRGAFYGNTAYTEYTIDLANPNITYSEEELAEIKLADVEAKADGGPFDGEHRKRVLYNKRLVETCSSYAEPLGLGTSSSSPSRFLYNGQNKFIFLYSLTDKPVYQSDTIVLFDA